ncbi:class F sortase [Spirillospora sp. NPDC127200]
MKRLALVLLAAALTGCGGEPAAAPPPPNWKAVPGQVANPSPTPSVRAYADPVEIRIPALGVRSRLERLETDAHGVLSTPRDPARAGWFAGGVRPGEQGPAVIAGHVDSRTGPGVFARLRDLRPGGEIQVVDAKGDVARFTARELRVHPKALFPSAEVYGPTPDAELRLITCGGAFDRARGHYADNVVAYAVRA